MKNGVRQITFNLARIVLILFVLLWITGLSIVFIDTGFHPALIGSDSKVMIKLVCVLVLTFNGMLLHIVGLQIITRTDCMSRPQANLLCVIGAMSTTNWFLAGFIGSANLLAQFSFKFLLVQYAAVVIAACICACAVSGSVRQRLNWLRARSVLDEMGAGRPA